MGGISFFNGEFIPSSEARISVCDLGFVHGITVAEQLRTFQGKPFRVRQHLKRFFRGVELVGIETPGMEELEDAILEVAARNYELEPDGSDLGICLFATPGESVRFGGSPDVTSNLCIHSYRLPLKEIGFHYENGVALQIPGIVDVSEKSWPKNIKVRSRMHYFLAESEIKARHPAAMALMVDANGNLRETAQATPIFVFEPNELTIAPAEKVLSSVSLEYVLELAEELSMNVVRREINANEIGKLQGAFLCSTPFCVYSVGQIENLQFEKELPELDALRKLWKEKLGYDFEEQAKCVAV